MQVDLSALSVASVLPVAPGSDPFWVQAARLLLVKTAATVEGQGGEWSEVYDRLEALTPDRQDREAQSIRWTALLSTDWQALGVRPHTPAGQQGHA